MIFHTKMEKLKGLFFQETLKHWHFEELVKESCLSRERVSCFLKQLLKENFIIRIKPKGKMPYYLASKDFLKFRLEKRLYGFSLLEQSGLLEHLHSCKKIKTAIIFGSFSRGDWGKSSDLDLFLYGDDAEFEKGRYERKLRREIQLFSYQNPKKMKKELDPKILPNIAKGFNVTGNLEPFEVSLHA